MRQSSIAFDTKGLTLEGVVASPVGASGSLPGVVVCHPHPPVWREHGQPSGAWSVPGPR